MSANEPPYAPLLRFWFGEPGSDPLKQVGIWFKRDPALDERARALFAEDLARATAGQLDAWKATAEGMLSFIVLLDQMSRNIHRDTPAAFAGDARALEASLEAQARGIDLELDPVQRMFVYMPMVHAEDRAMQQRSVEAFERLLAGAGDASAKLLRAAVDSAIQHRDIVARFGRYPHRNAILGRPSTDEEIEFLKQPGSSF